MVVAHTGINAGSYEAMMENSTWHLAKVEGSMPDAGPMPTRTSQATWICRWTIRPVPEWRIPTVMRLLGNHPGDHRSKLEQVDGKWQVKQSQASLRKIDASEGSAVDQRVSGPGAGGSRRHQPVAGRAARQDHLPIHSFFALVQDDPSVQLVSDAQRRHAEQLQQDGLLRESYPSSRWRPLPWWSQRHQRLHLRGSG